MQQSFLQILDSGEQIGLKHFRPIKPLGSGDTGRLISIFFKSLKEKKKKKLHSKVALHGSVHLVELCGTGLQFAMKAMDKNVMLNRNKVIYNVD